MQKNNGTMGACAACKHQRKKCDDKCILAPFFPAAKSREFQAVHKVFGVSKVQKIMKNLVEEDRKRAADSLVWEAFCRQKDPVLGPFGEYRKVCDELKLYKSQCQQQMQQGGIVHKSTSGVFGWNGINNGMTNKGMRFGGGVNNNNNNHNHNVLNYVHNNRNIPIVDSSSYTTYTSHHGHGQGQGQGQGQGTQEKLFRQDQGDIDSVVIPLQQHSTNGFNQQFYLSGQFSPIDGKTMEDTIWEARS